MGRMLGFERLEQRMLLAADFGDAPAPYPTLLVENGARHEAIGPTLGSARDTEANGVHSVLADGDGADEDGVTFGTIRVGQLGATLTVNVQNAPGGAKLDAWIDFDGDGNWGGPAEHIADSINVGNGDNVIVFGVPSSAANGVTYARFRLSSIGNMAVGGAAADGDVEDYVVTIDSPTSASGVFGQQNVISTSALGAQCVYAIDIDGDGDVDTLSASSGDDKIAWYENDGVGNFTAHTIATSANGANSVFAADLDGDGDVDALSASSNDDKIAWYENDGAQNFTARTISAAINGANSVHAADLDGDGDLDVLATSLHDYRVYWWANDGTPGNGGWASRVVASNVTTPDEVSTADVDSDGDLDVVAVLSHHRVVWFENDGTPLDGGWTYRVIDSQSVPPPNVTNSARDVTISDIDSDGDMDAVSASFNGIQWHENDGFENFTAHVLSKSGSESSVLAADVDGDGDIDILSATTNDDRIAWYENDGNQYVASHNVNSPDPDGNSGLGANGDADSPRRIYAADVDGDGDLDVLSASTNDSKIAWYENFRYAVTITTSPTDIAEEGPDSIAYNFNRVGSTNASLTLHFAVSGEAEFGVDYTVIGGVSFDATSGTIELPAGVNQTQLIVIPLDDSEVELEEAVTLTPVVTPNVVFLGLSRATGFITSAEGATRDFGDAPSPYPTSLPENRASHEAIGPTLGALRDTEDDGTHSAAADADGADDDGVTFGMIRVGQLNATAIVNVQNAPAGGRLDAWIDFDGDGNWNGPADQIVHSVDVVNGDNVIFFDVPSGAVSGATFARLRLSTTGNLEPIGAAADGEVEDYVVTIEPPTVAGGVFGPQITISSDVNTAQSVFAADLDGDGDQDVLSASQIDSKIAWYENDGAEGFTAHTITTTAYVAWDVYAADVDGDGDTDVLSASKNDSKIAWYENDGTPAVGDWTVHTITIDAAHARSVYAADLDGDGDLDVLSASSYDNKIAWYENGGAQDFTAHTITMAAIDARSVHAADVDGDGDLDVLSASYTDDKIAWYENDGTPSVGAWTARNISTVANGAFEVHAADVDGDGDVDILSASRTDNKVAWYENDGTPTVGAWTARTISTTSLAFASSVFPADIDGDGDFDVLAAGNNSTVWYENDGTPAAGNWTSQTVGTGAASAYAADVDGDGDLDVLTPFFSTIAWYENARYALSIDSSPSTVPEEGVENLIYTFNRVGPATEPLTLNFAVAGNADFNVDYTVNGASSFDDTSGSVVFPVGVTQVQIIVTPVDDPDAEPDETIVITLLTDPRDLVVGSSSAVGTITSAESSIDFGDAPPSYPTLHAANGARHEATGPRLGAARDTETNGAPSPGSDGDGTDDDGVTWGAIRVGELGAAVTVNVQNAPDGAKLDAWIDLDGDGYWRSPSEQIARSVTVVNGSNQVLFNIPSGTPSGVAYARFRLSTAGNLGITGLAADGEVEDYAVTILPPLASEGVFGGQNTITTAADGAFSVHAADVDGDGDMDALSASRLSGVAWFENDGNQHFTTHTISTQGAWGVFSADIDSDGDHDVLTASTWFENDGDQNFTAHAITATAAGSGVFACDIDGDGDLDILTANPFNYNREITWYENNAQSFVAHTIGKTTVNGHSISASDIDGDGDLDIVAQKVTGISSARIAWFENDGTPSVGTWVSYDVATAEAGILHLVDVDKDGDVDIMNSVQWFENDGTPAVGTWTSHTIVTAANGAWDIDAADVDGDGDLDVLSASGSNNKITWYENDGTPAIGDWDAHTITVSADGANSVLAVDVDGDGDLDVLSASYSDDKIAWYENLLAGDYDRDFDVDAADYEFWKSHFGESTGPGLAADGNGNGVVDAADYGVWRDNLGNSQNAGAGAGAASVVAALAEPFVTASPVPPSSSGGATLSVDVASSASLSVPTPGTRTKVSAPARDQLFSQWDHRRSDSLLLARTRLPDSVRLHSDPFVTKCEPNEAAMDAALGDLAANSVVGRAARRLGRSHASL